MLLKKNYYAVVYYTTTQCHHFKLPIYRHTILYTFPPSAVQQPCRNSTELVGPCPFHKYYILCTPRAPATGLKISDGFKRDNVYLSGTSNTLILLYAHTLRKINQKNNNNGKGDDLKPYYIYTYKSITIHM